MKIISRIFPGLLLIVLGCSQSVEVSEKDFGDSSSSENSEKQVSNQSVNATTVSLSKESTTDSWPNWMGPNHDGISHETGWSSNWPEEGLPVVWSEEIGIGFSSMSVDKKHLFTMGHVDGDEFVYCLNPETGKEIWSHSYPCKLVNNLHEGGPGSTPTIDGDFVYSVGREGQVICFEKESGNVKWERDLQKDLKMKLPEWGFTGSPYILENQLILNPGAVISYEKSTGDLLWKTEDHDAGYGSVIAFPYQGKTVLASLDCDGVRVVESNDGKEIAFFGWKSPFQTNSTTPIIVKDKIFISTGYQIGCALLELKNDKLELIYKNRKMRNHFNNSILLDGYLYGFDGNSNMGRVVQVTCMNFETGEVAWKERGMGCGSLMIADGKLLILSEDGKLILANASPEKFEKLAESDFLDGRCWTVPVLFDGKVYGRNAAGKLVCVKLPKE